MLVCNVSLRPPRLAIAAEIAEVVEAADATATGNVVFATLVDDPANVLDIVDAYSGEIMLEAASADATADAGLLYAAAIDEVTAAADTQDGTASAAPPARSAMVLGVFVDAGTSREAYVDGAMMNQ